MVVLGRLLAKSPLKPIVEGCYMKVDSWHIVCRSLSILFRVTQTEKLQGGKERPAFSVTGRFYVAELTGHDGYGAIIEGQGAENAVKGVAEIEK